MTQFSQIKNRIHVYVIPLLVTLLTFLVVSYYTSKQDIAVIQNTVINSKQNQEQILKSQEEVLIVARESRTFSMENNKILIQKADREDVLNIQQRLILIEKKVDKIYLQYTKDGWTFQNNDSNYYFNIYTKQNNSNVFAKK